MRGRNFDITKRITATAQLFRELFNRNTAAPPGGQEGPWLYSGELRSLFRISARTLDNWKKEGVIQGWFFGGRNHFSLAGVLELIENSRNQNPCRGNEFSFRELVLLDSNDLCGYLRISSRTEFRWRTKLYLPHIRIRGRIYYSLADISAFLEEHTQHATIEADVGATQT